MKNALTPLLILHPHKRNFFLGGGDLILAESIILINQSTLVPRIISLACELLIPQKSGQQVKFQQLVSVYYHDHVDISAKICHNWLKIGEKQYLYDNNCFESNFIEVLR